MISKKYIWIFAILAVLVLLTSCNNDQVQDEQNNEQEPSSSEENQNGEEPDGQEDESPSQEEDTNNNDGNSNEDPSDEPEEQQEEELVEPQYEVSGVWSLKPIIQDANEKVVLLTIDDAPDKHGLEMAQTLKDLDVPAIFFVNGHFLDTDEEKDILKQIHEMGFPIGNHTYNHTRLSTVTEEEQKEEILSLSNLIEEIIGEKPVFFRAPNGVNTEFSTQFVKEQGMLQMNWTYGYDWESEYTSEEAIADIMVNTPLLGNGANLLMHDRPWTADALDDIVNGLREKGYDFVDPKQIKLPE